MTNEEILLELSRHHITLSCEIKDNQIYTTVSCPYWVRKSVTFPMTHSLEFTEHEAKCYFIPQVLKMAGLRVKEVLSHD